MLNTLLHGFSITHVPGFWVIIGLIILDCLFGLLASAKERKLNSSVNFNGLIRKTSEILAIVLFTLMDTYLKTNGGVIKLGIGMLFVYEGLSIIENAHRVGLNLDFLSQFFDKNKIGNNDEK